MIIAKLTGGLGNQMFQYANGKAVSMRKNSSLFLDISWYKGRIDRQYMLNFFNIEAKIVSRLNIIWTKLFHKENYLEGNWQSEKYFKDIKDIIRKEFEIKEILSDNNKTILDNILSENSVSVHLRGGDYVRGKKSNFHGVCSPGYYQEAFKKIRESVESPHFFIFTDDLEWAQKHIELPEPNFIISKKDNKPYEELFLMSKCKHNIIANSTFSWWGAWLNNNPSKIVISPTKWFNDRNVDSKDIIPESWIKM